MACTTRSMRMKREPLTSTLAQPGRAGASAATAETQLLNEIGTAIDLVVNAGAAEVYLEITAVPAHRIPYVIAPVVANPTSLPATSPAPAAPASPALSEPQSS